VLAPATGSAAATSLPLGAEGGRS